MKLLLERPICFVDLETTGTKTDQDRIVQISICKVFPDWSKEVKTHYVNPGTPIPKEASDVHGIMDETVKDKPLFKSIAKGLLKYIDGCDIGGFKSNGFDVPMLYYEFVRAGIDWDYKKINLVDVGNIYHIKNTRKLSDAYKFYCGKELVGAHDAEADILATVDVFLGQLKEHEDLPGTISELAHFSNYDKEWLDISGKFSRDIDGDIVINFGKNTTGKKAKDNISFLEWMLKNDFPPDTKKIASDVIKNVSVKT